MSINSTLQVINLDQRSKESFLQAENLKSLAVQGKKLLIWDILITTSNGDRKIMEPIKMTNGTAARLRKLNQFYQFR